MSQKPRWLLFALALALLLVMAACGSGGDQDKSAALTESYSGTNGVSLKYPKGWIVTEENGQITVATSDQATSGDSIPQGEAAVLVLDPALAAALGSSLSPTDILTMLGEQIGGGNATGGKIKKTTVNGQQAARMAIKDATGAGEGIALAIDLGADHAVVVIIATAAGELKQNEATGLAITGSIRYQAP